MELTRPFLLISLMILAFVIRMDTFLRQNMNFPKFTARKVNLLSAVLVNGRVVHTLSGVTESERKLRHKYCETKTGFEVANQVHGVLNPIDEACEKRPQIRRRCRAENGKCRRFFKTTDLPALPKPAQKLLPNSTYYTAVKADNSKELLYTEQEIGVLLNSNSTVEPDVFIVKASCLLPLWTALENQCPYVPPRNVLLLPEQNLSRPNCSSLQWYVNEVYSHPDLDLSSYPVTVVLLSLAVAREGSVKQMMLSLARLLLPGVSPREIVRAVIKGHAMDVKSDIQNMSAFWSSESRGIKSSISEHPKSQSSGLETKKRSSRFDLEKETNETKQLGSNSWSFWFSSFRPRLFTECTVYPTSFLPLTGSPPKDSMSHLGCRLASLNSLPATCNISRVRLAEAGFYYDNSKTTRDVSNVHEVICYSCGLTYRQWEAGDNPKQIHLTLKSNCKHLNDTLKAPDPFGSSSSLTSFRTSLSSGYASMESLSQQASPMTHSSPSQPDNGVGPGISSYAASVVQRPGFATLQRNGIRGQYNFGDLEPDCAAIVPSSSQPIPSFQRPEVSPFSRDSSTAWANDLDDRPTLDMGSAVYPQFCGHKERLATFTGWPLSTLFRPEDLVMQGFYYAGYEDCLRCFYCGVGLKSWAEGDVVMQQHIRWRQTCGYILNIKGRKFVNETLNSLQVKNTQEPNRQTNSGHQEPSERSTTKTPQQTLTRSNNSGASVAGGGGGNTDITELVKNVAEMGFSSEAIFQCVDSFRQEGSDISGDALVSRLLDLQLNNTSNSSTSQQQELQTDGLEAVSYEVGVDSGRVRKLLSENERLKSRQICKICQEAKVGMIFLPCGHIIACTQCGAKAKHCTHCKQYIRATANVFLT